MKDITWLRNVVLKWTTAYTGVGDAKRVFHFPESFYGRRKAHLMYVGQVWTIFGQSGVLDFPSRESKHFITRLKGGGR